MGRLWSSTFIDWCPEKNDTEHQPMVATDNFATSTNAKSSCLRYFVWNINKNSLAYSMVSEKHMLKNINIRLEVLNVITLKEYWECFTEGRVGCMTKRSY